MAASASSAAGEEDWVLPSEVEVLESIYLDELQVMKGNGRYVLSKGRAGVSVVREFCTESGLRVL